MNQVPSPVFSFETPPEACLYVPEEVASLNYRFYPAISAEQYGDLLARGWRRFGMQFFRPGCPNCVKCQSLRIIVDRFKRSRTQTKVWNRNAHMRVEIGKPTVDRQRVLLFNTYHQFMSGIKGWPANEITEQDYADSFVRGDNGFARELAYCLGSRLRGVALVDVVPDAVSSVYFYHAPNWRARSPGVFSILKTLEFAKELGRPHLHLGYWIEECGSMAYKSRFRPHEILLTHPPDNEEPVWRELESQKTP